MKNDIRLLIVDDDVDDRQFFIDSVKEINANIACDVAKDGLHALQLLNDNTLPLPHFIFLDLRMPRYNGKKALMEIKTSERLKHIPVIIYSTSSEESDYENLKALGAAHFITKPHSPEEVYYILSVVLEEQLELLGKKL